MANIKFSQFTVGNTESDIDFVVGYKGANNIQISPANLLAASLSGYLPLAGGTMTGTSGIHMPDNFALKAGNSQDLRIYHEGTDSIIQNYTGSIYIDNNADDKDIVFRCDDGAGGLATYFFLDGSNSHTNFQLNARWVDNSKAQFGNSGDMELYHDANHSYVKSGGTGDLYIQQFRDDGDIVFQSDDGSGGMATYFFLDGSIVENRFSKATRHSDNIIAKFGDSNDLNIYSNGLNSYIENFNNDFIISNTANDQDIKFFCDDGSGGVTEYFRVDGSSEKIIYSKNQWLYDNIRAVFGSSDDLQIFHNGTSSYIENTEGNIVLVNYANDKDIQLYSDDGSGGTTEYFRLDGSMADGTNRFTKFGDNSWITMGDGGDLLIGHQTTSSKIENYTGPLYIVNKADDQDIIFQSDDGSGGVAEYLRLDGGIQSLVASKDLLMAIDGNGGKLKFGASQDLQIFHNGTDSFIDNYTGNLTIRNRQDDGDIIFTSDDGSGGLAEYFRLDGSTTSLVVSASLGMYFNDGVAARFGTGGDLILYHDGSNSFIADTGTGKLKVLASQFDIINAANTEFMAEFIENAEVRLYYNNSKKFETTTDGINVIGGTTTGSTHRLSVGKTASGVGNHKSILELSENTQGTDMNYGFSFTADGDGTNNLFIRRHNNNTTGATVMTVNRNDDNVTFAGNLKVQGVSEHADNTAAIAAGLTTGQLYRTGDLLKIVH